MKQVIEYARYLGIWFWDPKFWLPSGITWDDLKNSLHIQYPQFYDLWIPIFLACAIIILRYLFERYIAYPLGRIFHLRDNRALIKKLNAQNFKDNDLEKLYNKYKHEVKSFLIEKSSVAFMRAQSLNKNLYINGSVKERKRHFSSDVHTSEYSKLDSNDFYPNGNHTNSTLLDNKGDLQAEILKLMKETSYSPQHVMRYLKKRQSLDRPGKLVKFGESCWRFLFYLVAFWYGLVILHKKPWFWDTSKCWENYPFQPLTRDVWWYYMVEMSFYWSLMASQFWDTKRKDFWQMLVHHVCALLLLTFSWVANMVRVGTLVLVIHDAVDYWLEAVKVSTYLKYPKMCTFFFAVFTVTWFVTRLLIFPYRVVYPAMFQAHVMLNSFFAAYYLYNVLLLILLGLNVTWFYMICVMAYNSIKYGEIKKDVRSSSEASENDNQPKGNGFISTPKVPSC